MAYWITNERKAKDISKNGEYKISHRQSHICFFFKFKVVFVMRKAKKNKNSREMKLRCKWIKLTTNKSLNTPTLHSLAISI